MDVDVRPVTRGDSTAVASLITQLGYPSTPAQIDGRLIDLLAHPEYITLIAEASGAVVGLVGAQLSFTVELDGLYGRITGLVIDANWRGRGIGTLLMRRIERELTDRGVTVVTLTSGKHRREAHAFYKAIGYEETGLRFIRRL